MIKTCNVISSMDQVPNTWIFEFYLRLPQKLNGGDIKMKSVFNIKDTNPSFFVYKVYGTDIYKFKDFSSGKQGDGIELVKEIYNLPKRYEAASKIINDYNNYLDINGASVPQTLIQDARYKLYAFKVRPWNTRDQEYWTSYHISSNDLEKYNIKALEYFVLRKPNRSDQLIIKNLMIYGFFKKDGTLYKIYQPLLKENKFFKVCEHIQGLEQLTFKVPYLIICSSLKDLMAFNKLGFSNAECIAPDSENVTLSLELIKELKKKYKKICTLFDNDEAGNKAMEDYLNNHAIHPVFFKIEKDIADAIKIHNPDNIRIHIYPLLTKVLTGKIKHL